MRRSTAWPAGAHEVRTWVAAAGAAECNLRTELRYYHLVPEWITGMGIVVGQGMIEPIRDRPVHGLRHLRRRLPADVIHGAVAVAPEVAGFSPHQAAAGDQVPRALHHLLQLRDLLPGADRRRASLGQEPAAALVTRWRSSTGPDRNRRAGGRRRRRRADRRAQRQAPWRLRDPGHAHRFMDDRPHRPHRLLQCLDDRRLPGDDIDGITREIVAGNDGVADQFLVRERLEQSMPGSRTSRRSA